jgi:hypothetical protein
VPIVDQGFEEDGLRFTDDEVGPDERGYSQHTYRVVRDLLDAKVGRRLPGPVLAMTARYGRLVQQFRST